MAEKYTALKENPTVLSKHDSPESKYIRNFVIRKLTTAPTKRTAKKQATEIAAASVTSIELQFGGKIYKSTGDRGESVGIRPTPVKVKNQLEALKIMSKVVADTGELGLIERYHPVDVTTNPSLVYKAVESNENLLNQEFGRNASVSAIADRLNVQIGAQILKIIPGRVSTEADARLSYDTVATYDKALHLLDLYSKEGYDPSRIYIKIASTWEGIRACERLEKEGIDCNMTLLFSFAQAAAAADAGAALISPFVGRILDWYKKNKGRDYTVEEDPGVLSVKRVYSYYKQYGFRTTVMAASFRTADQVRALAGIDAITISPAILQQLEESTDELPYQLWPSMGGAIDPLIDLSSHSYHVFEQMHGGDAMAVEQLAKGIEGFSNDAVKLEALLAQKLGISNK